MFLTCVKRALGTHLSSQILMYLVPTPCLHSIKDYHPKIFNHYQYYQTSNNTRLYLTVSNPFLSGELDSNL